MNTRRGFLKRIGLAAGGLAAPAAITKESRWIKLSDGSRDVFSYSTELYGKPLSIDGDICYMIRPLEKDPAFREDGIFAMSRKTGAIYFCPF